MIKNNKDMSKAPRNGTAIIVGAEDAGEFVMAWNKTGQNEFFCPGEVGIWEAIDKSFTWGDGPTGDCGPTYWRYLD